MLVLLRWRSDHLVVATNLAHLSIARANVLLLLLLPDQTSQALIAKCKETAATAGNRAGLESHTHPVTVRCAIGASAADNTVVLALQLFATICHLPSESCHAVAAAADIAKAGGTCGRSK